MLRNFAACSLFQRRPRLGENRTELASTGVLVDEGSRQLVPSLTCTGHRFSHVTGLTHGHMGARLAFCLVSVSVATTSSKFSVSSGSAPALSSSIHIIHFCRWFACSQKRIPEMEPEKPFERGGRVRE